jgi:translation initiation factor IF-2
LEKKEASLEKVDQVKVLELASEFELKDRVVISELKKIGVWVPSADTLVDFDIANRIRRRLQLMVEIEQEEQVKAEKAKEKKKTTPAKRKTIKQLGRPRKAATSAEEEPVKSPLVSSLKPRKGQASYRSIEEAAELALEKTQVTIDDEPIIEKVEAHVSADALEQVQEAPMTAVEAAELALEAGRRRQAASAAKAPPAEVEKPSVDAAVGGEVETPETPKTAVEAAVVPEAAEAVASVPPGTTVLEGAEAEKAEAVEAEVEEVAAETVAEPEDLTEEEIRAITLTEAVSVKELSEKLGVKSKDLISELFRSGIMVTINQTLDHQIVQVICEKLGFEARFVSATEAEVEKEAVEELPEDIVTRAPVVTVMGHVDHGKTSLLDAIRETKVADGEAGGITQHIGAYHVSFNNRRVVFVDTPGHEAFTLMRARGAQVTDIVVLVVAADDGVMPQSLEAIDHARAANVPILVAINKIDRPEAQPDRVKQQLSERELVPEDWGGDTVMVEVSAIEKTNLNLLLEMILLVSDLHERKANPKRPASAIVLEARLDRGRGPIATLLVQDGTLHVGDSFVAGMVFGKVRALFDDRGEPIAQSGPGSAVEIQGLNDVPQAGDQFQVLFDPNRARELADERRLSLREKGLARSSRVGLDNILSGMDSTEAKNLNLVVKADTQGSVEVVGQTLERLSAEKVRIRVIHSGVGAISESDVLLASASQAVVIGFNIRPERSAQETAEREEVEIRLYTIIYELIDEIRQSMLGLLDPTIREKLLGRAEVRQTFKVSKIGTIAGCNVSDGLITRNAELRLLRDNVVVHEGKVGSLRRFQEDVNEVKNGYECGISIANFNDVKVGDVIEAFVKESVEPQLV